MGSNKDIEAVQVRIAKAQSDLEAWRTTGMQEKYLEAYSRVSALELELDRLREQGLRTLAAANDSAKAPGEWQHLMARLASSRRLKNPKH